MTSTAKATRRLVAAVAVAGLSLTVAACGDDTTTHDASSERTASNGDVLNDADVAFATAMIPHHAEALSMVDLTQGRPLSPAVRRLAVQIREAQAPEIEQMVDWLTAWGEPVPATMRDHVHGDHPDDQMAELESAPDGSFEDVWLQAMIEHHEGAVAMAHDEQEDGTFGPAVDLAGSIVTSQQDEIDRMQALLED
ncbi:MAG TPA: DUF305 domain-containing protein [Nocardioides sp.]|nr:DUF305 domain-containing protein [Nocardioides sp.]